MLPYRPDVPTSPIIQYDDRNPPAVPDLRLPQHLAQWVNYVSANVANAYSMNLINASRTFAFNMLSSQGWRTNDFVETITLAFIILDLAQRQYRGQIDQNVVNDAISQAVTLYVSKLTCTIAELGSLCTQDQYNAAVQNYQKYQSYLQASGNQGGMMNGFPQQGNQQPYQSSPFGRGGAMPPSTLQTAVSGGSTGLSIGSGTVTREPTQQSKFFVKPKAEVRQDLAPSFEAQLTVNDWKTSKEQPYRAFYNPKTEKATYIRSNQGNVIEILTKLPEDMMDRDKHRLVAILGNQFNIGSNERNITISNEVSNMASLRATQITDAQQENVDEEIKAIVGEYIYPSVLVDIFLESAIFSGRVHQRSHRKDCGYTTAYRCFATVYRPQFTQDSYAIIIDKISRAKKFDMLADILVSSAKTLQNNINESADQASARHTDMGIYLNGFDVMLTEMINSFLANNLSIENLAIESFVEDIGSLGSYLQTKFSEAYSYALLRFESDIMDMLFSSLLEETDNYLASLLPEGDDNQNSFSFIPVHYSFTYLDVLSQEIGLQCTGNIATLIRESESSLLYAAAKSLFTQSDAMPISPTQNLLITQDNKIFKLYKGYLSKDSYLIGK